jgi:hypothetical protein
MFGNRLSREGVVVWAAVEGIKAFPNRIVLDNLRS